MERKEITEAQQLSSSWKKGTQLTQQVSPVPQQRGAKMKAQRGKEELERLHLFQRRRPVTNNHVVADCKEIRVPGSGAATVVTTDSANDLR